MNSSKTGTVSFVDIGTGHWVLHATDGKRYQLVDKAPKTSGLWDRFDLATSTKAEITVSGSTPDIVTTGMVADAIMLVDVVE